MRKRLRQVMHCRGGIVYLSMAFLFAVGSTTTAHANDHYDDLPVKSVTATTLFSGTAPGAGEFITLDFAPLSTPDDPMVGDEVCFEFTATNISNDSLSGVQIKSDGDIVLSANLLAEAALLPNGVEEPDANPFTGSGTFVLTGSGCTLLTADDIALGFALRPVNVMGVNEAGDMVTDCISAVSCFGVTLTCTDLNISLDAECETLLTPELLRVNVPVELYSALRIRIQEEDGSFRSTPLLTNDDVGTSVNVVIDIPGCSNVAPCWSFANIEFKLGPSQICTDPFEVTCLENVAISDPIITFACGNAEFIRGEVIREDICRGDTLFRESVTFAVRDDFGNISESCTQIKYVTQANIVDAGIDFPPPTTEVSCEATFFNDEGIVDPRILGGPTFQGIELYDNIEIVQLCNVFAEFEDLQDIDGGGCTRTIIRRWIVSEWLCEGGINRDTGFQRIVLRDTTPPEIDLVVDNITISASQNGCMGIFDIPEPILSDNCQPSERIELEIVYPGGSNIVSDDLLNIPLPLGLDTVFFIARDGCGNEDRDTMLVNVVDVINPVAVCLREFVVSIPDDKAWVDIDNFDEGSFDACQLESRCVVRSDHETIFMSLGPNANGDLLFAEFDAALQAAEVDRITCARDYSEGLTRLDTADRLLINIDDLCTEAILICCFDAGVEVPIKLRVEDASGNRNECHVMISGQDKDAAVITCPTEVINVSCDFVFDPNGNLDNLFGTILEGSVAAPLTGVPDSFIVSSSGPLVNGTFTDNCSIGSINQDRVVDMDSVCQTGTITRTFSIMEGGVSRNICQQVINIVGDQNNNPLVFEFFPADVRLEAENPDDVENLAEDNPPIVRDVGCSLIGLGFRDRVFVNDDNSIYCTKIVRTWEVIDWCRNRGATIELDSQQIILVLDNDAPEVTLNTNISVPQPLPPDIIEVTATATDNVVSNPQFLEWVVVVTEVGSATELSRDTLDIDDFRNSTAVANLGNLVEGDYVVTWSVTDPCGNTDVIEQDLTVLPPQRDETVVSVTGQVASAFGPMMDNIDVFLGANPGSFDDAIRTATNLEGQYAFANMEVGQSYHVDAEKDDDHLNGVTTLDLILVQRHVLGLQRIEDPYLMIAADVNKDLRITSLDLVDLRKLILGITDRFPSNDSWTFVHADQDIEQGARFGIPLEESYFIQNLQSDLDIQFIGIKTGDVSGDAVAHSTGISGSRSSSQDEWTFNVNPLGNGLAALEVLATEDQVIEGFQGALSWDKVHQLVSVVPGVLRLSDTHYNDALSENGLLPIAYASEVQDEISEGDILFTLIFETSRDMHLSLDQGFMRAQVYNDKRSSDLLLTPQESIVELGEITLQQNTPNPWSENTEIRADLPIEGEVTFRVFDLQQRVIHQESRWVEKGSTIFRVSQEDIGQIGLYFYEVEIGGHIARHKMIKVN